MRKKRTCLDSAYAPPLNSGLAVKIKQIMWFINRTSKNDTAIINEILSRVLVLLDESNDSDWSELNVSKTKGIIKTQLKNIKENRKINIKKIRYLFLPTAPLQEISMANEWANEYLELAEKFDKIS